MIITGTKHQALSVHVSATGPARAIHVAPQAVYTVLAALMEPADIVASHATYFSQNPTRWRVWAVSSTRLAFVEFEFDADDYDAQEESNRLHPENISPVLRMSAPRERLVSAWVRPLATALKMKSGSITREYPGGVPAAHFSLNKIAVEFADGTRVPAEGALTLAIQPADGDGLRWDEFVAAIRAGSPYLTFEMDADPPLHPQI